MACFLVPAAEAVVVTAAAIAVHSAEKKKETQTFTYTAKSGIVQTGEKVSFSRKLTWLIYLLVGGSALLAFEHLWHGEVVAWFPFLTAAASPDTRLEILHEMSTVGVTMALAVTAVWAVIVAVTSAVERRAIKSAREGA